MNFLINDIAVAFSSPIRHFTTHKLGSLQKPLRHYYRTFISPKVHLKSNLLNAMMNVDSNCEVTLGLGQILIKIQHNYYKQLLESHLQYTQNGFHNATLSV